MSSTPSKPPVHDPAAKPAGGMGAILSTARQLAREKAVVPGTNALRVLNQDGGVDCPGCAWPEPAAGERSHFEFCENGAKAVAAEATRKRVTPEFFARYSIDELQAQSDYWLEQQGRVAQPVILREGKRHFEPIGWDEAFAKAGAFLRDLPEPNQAAFYTSGRTSNEAAFLYQLFGRMYGTNNFPDCSNLCHESSGVGLKQTMGIGKGAVQLDDFEKADAIFIIGQNPGTNHPRMLTVLQAARRRGAQIVAINPLRERGLMKFAHPQEVGPTLLGQGTEIATVYLQPKPGSDVAVLKGMMKQLLEAERRDRGRVIDHGFIRAHCTGFEELVADLDATPWTQITEQSGLTQAEIRQASEVYIKSRATIICWAMGLTQHENAVDNIISISNLLLLRGNVGRPGAGPCPVRGHSNVQGDRTVGIDHNAPGWIDRLEAEFGFSAPRAGGYDVVHAIEAMQERRIRFFMAIGGNFLGASPDTGLVAEGLKGIDLAVHVTTKLNRTHVTAGREVMIWPCLGRTETDRQAGGEQFVTVEDSMSVVHVSRGVNKPASPHLKSEIAIVCGLAKAALPEGGGVDWDALAADYDRIRDHVQRVVPGFDDYNRRVREPGGFVLRNAAAHREWNTQTGRANFVVVPTPDIRLPEGQLRLFTIRSHDQYNTTIYGLDDRYRGIKQARRVILMHPDDIAERGLAPGDWVDIRSHAADGRARIAPKFRAVAYDVPRGCAAAYFPEANVLVPVGSRAKGSGTPSSKMVPVTVERATSEVDVVGVDERLVPRARAQAEHLTGAAV
ncbi:FdhF/YdeP family oxidoreductase [Longimicrobium sp.]|uniref:FdhF/YdeP family oxidoreductase n=1 Tax=Longimicrobium sp. TaxID=2029185 RepID=UPI002E350A29|nr:FdhF/YdeP family oxidoreductase [Longimicrobium sp.]HEX6037305.1 FdhF/YdeP family oxidoreductase [Longimicrobium sp.]